MDSESWAAPAAPSASSSFASTDSSLAPGVVGSAGSTEPKGKPWWELTLVVPCGVADDAGALLVDAGAMGAETLTHEAYIERAWQRHASMGPKKAREPKLPHQHDSCVVIASFAGDESEASVQASIAETLHGFVSDTALKTATLMSRNDTAWAHAWREHYKPLKIGRTLWIVPRWDTRFLPPMGSTIVRIDPGMAFGTGQHATTSLCLKAIERRLVAAREARAPLQVLDVGTGSGILAIGALALGASRATLTDIDADALAACKDNVESAGFTSRATVQAQLPDAPLRFGLVVANILAHTLIDMMPELLSRLEAKGTLLLSGILTEQADSVARAVARAAKAVNRVVPPVARLQHDQWVALAFGAPLDAPPAPSVR